MDDKALDYNYTKKLLKIYLKIIKLNPTKNFILRPYPSDKLYLKYYQRLLSKVKNVEINVNEDILYCLDKSDKVISGPDNVALEAIFFNIPVTVFYDPSKFDHKYIFADHPFLKYFPKQSFTNLEELNKFINSNNTPLFNKKLEKYYGLENDSINLISKRLTKNIKSKSKGNFLKIFSFKIFAFLLRKIIKNKLQCS